MLTIEPGVEVRFGDGLALQVDGGLIARGTVTQPITCTSGQFAPNPGAWGYMLFSDSSLDALFDADGQYIGGAILEYVTVAYGGSAASIQGAVRLNAASPYIHNSTIRHNANGGIYAYNNSAPRIEGNTVTDNRTTQERGGGIYVSGRAKVIGNTIRNNTVDRSACCNEGYGGGLYATNGAEVRANTIVNNTLTAYYRTYGGGLHVDGGTVTDNIITGNAIGPSNCGCGHARGGGLYANNSTVSGNTTTAQDSVAGGGLYASGSTVSGNTVADNTSTANNTDVWGGGIWATNSNLSNNVVSGNISVADDSVYGGAVHQQNGNFTGNTVVVSNHSTFAAR